MREKSAQPVGRYLRRRSRMAEFSVANPSYLADGKLSVGQLKVALSYDPETGVFRWASKTSIKSVVGSVAGTFNKKGYCYISLYGRRQLAHRLAWLYMTGEWPEHEVDHRDRNPSNNAWSNLRAATHAQNMKNVGPLASNTSGFKGVYWFKERRKWYAQIACDGKVRHLGYFKCSTAAHLAYVRAARELHGEFARTT